MWKKSGAWFYHDVPKYVLPEPRASGADASWTRRPPSSQQNWNEEWDSSGRQSPASSPGRKSQSSWGNSRFVAIFKYTVKNGRGFALQKDDGAVKAIKWKACIS